MSCKAKIKNRWSRKNWSWQTHLSFLFTLIVVIVPLLQIPSFVNRETNYRVHMAIACLLHSDRVVSSSNINRLYHGDWPFYSIPQNIASPS